MKRNFALTDIMKWFVCLLVLMPRLAFAVSCPYTTVDPYADEETYIRTLANAAAAPGATPNDKLRLQEEIGNVVSPGASLTCFTQYVLLQQTDAVRAKLFVQSFKDLEATRTDKQAGSSNSAGGTTNLVSSGLTAQALSVATEYGAVTESTSNQTVTVQGSLDGILAAAVQQSLIGYCPNGKQSPDPFCAKQSVYSWLRRFSYGVSFNASQPAQTVSGTGASGATGATGATGAAGATGSAQPVTFNASGRNISSVTARLILVNKRDATSKNFQDKWTQLVFGATGATGATGGQASKGAGGATGASGSTGTASCGVAAGTGAKGANGSTGVGAKGASGPTAAKAATGTAGAPGGTGTSQPTSAAAMEAAAKNLQAQVQTFVSALKLSPSPLTVVCASATLGPGGVNQCDLALTVPVDADTPVALASDNALVTVPGTVSVAKGKYTAQFIATTAGALSSSQTATVTATATLAGSAQTATASIAIQAPGKPRVREIPAEYTALHQLAYSKLMDDTQSSPFNAAQFKTDLDDAVKKLYALAAKADPLLLQQSADVLRSEETYDFTEQQVVECLANTPVLSVEYDDNRPQNQSSYSTVRLIYDQPFTGRFSKLSAIANFAAAINDNVPSTTSIPGASRFRDAQFGLQFKYQLSSAGANGSGGLFGLLGAAAVSATYYFQYQNSPTVLNVTPGTPINGITLTDLSPAATQIFAAKGNIHVGQLRLELGPAGSSVRFPIAVTYSNRTELITKPNLGAQFGISYDFDSLFAGSGKTQ